MKKTTILAVISTIIIMSLLIFVPLIAAWSLLAITIFMVLYTIIDLMFFYFKDKN